MSEAGKTARELFDEGIQNLDRATVAAITVSERNIGAHHTGRQNRALYLFAKLITHDMSIMSLIRNFQRLPDGNALLDHFSFSALARCVIDASLMTMYISHPTLTRDQWNLRRYVMYLHDTTNRKRFLSALPHEDDAFLEDYESSKQNVIAKIRRFSKALKLTSDKTADLVKGQQIFVDGARGAVREAGWDVKAYDFQQSYLSAYVHSHPVSFMRADEHEISFKTPSQFQLGLCGLAFNIAADHTICATERMETFSDRETGDPLGQVDD